MPVAKQILRHAISWVLSPISLFLFSVSLIRYLKEIKRGDVFSLPFKTNFGGTVYFPDMVRRTFPDKQVVFFSFKERFHNQKISLIWEGVKDLDFIHLKRFAIDVDFRGNPLLLPERHIGDRLSMDVLHILIQILATNPIVLRDRGDLTKAIPIPSIFLKELDEDIRAYPERSYLKMMQKGDYWINYRLLLREQSLLSPRLPAAVCSKVEEQLNKAREGKSVRFCGLYLKCSMANSDVESHTDGSSLEAYLPAVKFLVEKGYQVLLTGDRRLPREIYDEFGGMFVDSEHLDVDRDEYRLFSALHGDIFIADPAGGSSLAALDPNRPILCVNVFPFSFADGINMWLYYKHAYDKQGAHLEFEKMSSEFSFVNPQEGEFKILANTADEIIEAVQCYVEEMENPGARPKGAEAVLEKTWPAHSLFSVSHSHISPAYVRNYHRYRSRSLAQ